MSRTPEHSNAARPQSGSILKDTTDFFADYSNAPAQLNLIYTHATRTYLDRLDLDDMPSPRVIEQQLLALTNQVIKNENLKCGRGDTRYPQTKHLSYWQVAQILLRLHHVIRIAPDSGDFDQEYDLLAVYIAEGTGEGTYASSEERIRAVARQYNAALTLADFKEVVAVLPEDAPRVLRCKDRDLVAVNNGVFFYGDHDRTITINEKSFDFRAKSLHPSAPLQPRAGLPGQEPRRPEDEREEPRHHHAGWQHLGRRVLDRGALRRRGHGGNG